MAETIIISPSGKYYGSEQVLHEYLQHSPKQKLVYIPKRSHFLEMASDIQHHIVATYNNKHLKRFYFFLALKLRLGRIKKVYVNEGGHIRYIRLLAKLFRKIEFIVHIRMLEDTNGSRIGNVPDNLRFLIISNFLLEQLPASLKVDRLYDPFVSSREEEMENSSDHREFRIGVVGRIAATKGWAMAMELLEKMVAHDQSVSLHFFGEVQGDDRFKREIEASCQKFPNHLFMHGFIRDKNHIYSEIDLLLHLNLNEGLGRIILEAIDFCIPFLAFGQGGTKEIAELFHLEELLINPDRDYIQEIYDKYVLIQNNKEHWGARLKALHPDLYRRFSIKEYTKKIDIHID